MKTFISIDDFNQNEIHQLWDSVHQITPLRLDKPIGWSFAGNGVRTRTTFIRAFQQSGLQYIELPNLLKSHEQVDELAGYLDPFYALYVIREENHERLKAFAQASSRPVINAMSAQAHPCEVLSDGFWIQHQFGDIYKPHILLWGPKTNVFNSWYALAKVMGMQMSHYAPLSQRHQADWIQYPEQIGGHYDLIVTDGWPEGFDDPRFCLTEADLKTLGDPLLLPTPPVTVGHELQKPLSQYHRFVGYDQKQWLLPVQRAIIHFLLQHL
ncbi:MAG: Ornithine carbamoyltransferase, anabolic [Candidatus Celerinatantimonas neptuna]|nr:MAG: Ornithine carbamoyltransferase, anabolic [Candidatus Celerinatantimonas neptuna]